MWEPTINCGFLVICWLCPVRSLKEFIPKTGLGRNLSYDILEYDKSVLIGMYIFYVFPL